MNSSFGSVQFDLLEAKLFGDLRELLFDLLRGALVDLGQDFRLQDLLVERSEEFVFEALTGDERGVIAGVARGIEATVIAAALPAHERDSATAAAALQRAGQQVRWVRVHVALALALKALLPLVRREYALDFLPASLRGSPFLVRNDADVGALLDNPVFLRAIDLLHLAGERIFDGGGAIPNEATDVLLVLEDSRHGRDVPTALESDLGWYGFIVQIFGDPGDSFARNEVAEDALDDAGFVGDENEFETFSAKPPLLVEFGFALGHSGVAVAPAAHGKAAQNLAHLATMRLFLEICQVQLVDDAAELVRHFGVFLAHIEAITDRDEADPPVLEEAKQRVEVLIVAGQTRRVIHQDGIELLVFRSSL